MITTRWGLVITRTRPFATSLSISGKKQIHAMWHMICEGDIRATCKFVEANDDAGRVVVEDDYTFSATGRNVHNVIESHFRFRDGLIVEQRDYCDARRWAAMALGGIKGHLAGWFRLLRARKAREKLQAFLNNHPQYQ